LTKIRFVALVVAGLFIAPAITECALRAASSDSHACCAKRGTLAPEPTVTACCRIAAQSSDAAPAQAQAAAPSLRLVTAAFASFVNPGMRAPIPADAFSARPAAVVPLYLLQASLLI
jgi:hypothetical protein